MKNNSAIYPIILAGLLLLFMFNCKKEDSGIVPTISISSVTTSSATGAASGGDITNEGTVAVTSRGVCWSTKQNPTITDYRTIDGSGSGSFTSSINGLSPGITYYLRAYAINAVGVGYSAQITFSTVATVPVLTTSALSSVTVNSAVSGGNISSNGGAAITARGICWSTSQNPTIAGSKTNDGTGTGTFTSSITGLSAGVAYYFRAYATNSAGTGYGNQLTAVTTSGAPIITDGTYITLQKATTGKGIDIVFMGDGYTTDDIASKKYENNIRQEYASFFNIEPYKSYAAYFNVYMVYAISDASGISDLTTTVKTKFETKYTETGNSTAMSANLSTGRIYAQKAPILDINNTLAIIVANSTRYGGTTYIHGGPSGLNTSICPMPSYYASYILQHEAGGHGFGDLADEYVTNTGLIPQSEINNLLSSQYYGTFMNVDTTGNLTRVLWNHFIGLLNYSYVSAYQGGDLYSQGVWRPELNSIMVNNIKYFNAPSRELIVKRIMKLTGATYSFSAFQSKDVMELTKGAILPLDKSLQLPPPVIVR